MTKYSVVTTFNFNGYKKYGQKFIQSYLKNWPIEVTLYTYAEDCEIEENAENLIKLDLHNSCPDLVKFKNKWKHIPKANGDVSDDPIRSKRKDAGKGFKWDAVRFSNKVYAIFDCAKVCNCDYLIWMDADMICHSPISVTAINKLIPESFDLCFLGREKKFSECGLYAMNLRSSATQEFLKTFQHFYDKGIIFNFEEWHDSFIFDEVRKTLKLHELNWSKGLINGEGHPLINSAWGAYLDHLKGNRKSLGKSLKEDLLIKRVEKYWNE